MWICMNDAFLSIVNDPTDYRTLQVRARDRQHLVNFWKELEPKLGEAQFELLIASSIDHTPDRDYQWRSFVYREDVANMISNRILNIYYNKDIQHLVHKSTNFGAMFLDIRACN